MNSTTQHSNFSAPMGRRSFLALAAGMAALAPAALTACGQTQSPSSSSTSTDSSSSYDISGKKLTFVGDNAFAPYRYIEMQSDGSQKTVGLDIAIADEMASRLGFTYDFEPQEFAATLATIQSSDTSFTMAMSSNAERLETFDFTRGYYEPRVGVLTMGDKVKDIDGLKGKSIACTTGTVQNKFVTAVLPDADVHTYDGGDQCLQEVLAGRIDAYVCDGAEGQSMAIPASCWDSLTVPRPRTTSASTASWHRRMLLLSRHSTAASQTCSRMVRSIPTSANMSVLTSSGAMAASLPPAPLPSETAPANSTRTQA